MDGEYRDLPPTGQLVHMHGIAVDIVKGGRIIDHAAYFDENAITRQCRPKESAASSSADMPPEDHIEVRLAAELSHTDAHRCA